MRCVLCGRYLSTAAACFAYGPLRGEPVGPKCAKRAGLSAKRRRMAAPERRPADPETLPLFELEAA